MDIKSLRKENNLTLDELAKALGVSKQIVSAWELGKKEIPSARIPQLKMIFANAEKYRTYTIELTYDEYMKFKELFAK